ncbi:MAG: DUF1643 domain-containing protein [Gemmataceae bacterium]
MSAQSNLLRSATHWPKRRPAKGAIFSACRRYRYLLWRSVAAIGGGTMTWIMLNPSTAGASADDPTIRRCQVFTRSWGFGRMLVVNLFAFRATLPTDLREAEAPVGPDNDRLILQAVRGAERVVCAWGVHGELHGRGELVRARLTTADVDLYHVGLTRFGHPRHPLYLPASTLPVVWA